LCTGSMRWLHTHVSLYPGVYDIDTSLISVSGVSAGGYMAVQFHVAYSSSIMGAGIVAAGKGLQALGIFR